MHTESLILNALLFVLGLAILVKGSDWFIESAAFIARTYGIPDVIIGLTLVSIGTSLPELATNVYAALKGNSGVALGNVVGSNIANTLLILGVAATCMKTIPVTRILFHRDAVAMMGVFVIFACFCYFFGGAVTRLEAGILFAIFVLYLFRLMTEKRDVEQSIAAELHPEHRLIKSRLSAVIMLLIGGALVVLGAKLMVDNVVWAAVKLNVPEELVSATVIAFGTSVPELAVTVAGVIKKKNDIALGNIIGSNIFNLALIMGVTGLIVPVPVSADVQIFLLPCMLVTGAILMLFLRTKWTLVRWEGIAFLLGYLAFIGSNIYQFLR